jgi:hypothetical protein
MPAVPAHFEFWLEMLRALNENGHDLAVFFLHYTLTGSGEYPTQLRQAIEALRYILKTTNRSPSKVIVGGDSAGGNLATATLLHLSHPHPDIEPLAVSAPLAGVFAYAPWVSFSTDWPSFKENQWRDILTSNVLTTWSNAYRGGKPADQWNEPFTAPVEWWRGAKTEKILILAGGCEILLSPIEAFAKKIKVCAVSCLCGWFWLTLDLYCSPSSLRLFIMSVLMRRMTRRSTCLPRKRRRQGQSFDSGWLLVCDFIGSVYYELNISCYALLYILRLCHTYYRSNITV